MTGETARAASPSATPWAFLAGAWRGVGRLRDTDITTASRFRPSLGGALEGEIACVPVSAEGHFLLVDPSVAQKVWKWSRSGDDIAAIVGRLAPAEAS